MSNEQVMNNFKIQGNSIVIQSVSENVIPEYPSQKFKEGKIKQHKKRINYTINKHTIDRFKQLCQKRDWIMSVVVENNIKRLVDNL